MVVVLDRPRHEELIARIREAGARIKLIPDGDVAGAISTAFSHTGIDMLVGIGGAPEGVIAAVALKCMGGDMMGRLKPQNETELRRLREMGIDNPDRVLYLDDLVRGDDAIFAATGLRTASSCEAFALPDRRRLPIPWSCARKPVPCASWMQNTASGRSRAS